MSKTFIVTLYLGDHIERLLINAWSKDDCKKIAKKLINNNPDFKFLQSYQFEGIKNIEEFNNAHGNARRI